VARRFYVFLILPVGVYKNECGEGVLPTVDKMNGMFIISHVYI